MCDRIEHPVCTTAKRLLSKSSEPNEPNEPNVIGRDSARRRLKDVEREGLTPVALAGLWTMPLWRTLQQVHPGGSLHWQTLAVAGGFISDVLIRLCRAAAESYADHVQLGKNPAMDKRLHAAEARGLSMHTTRFRST